MAYSGKAIASQPLQVRINPRAGRVDGADEGGLDEEDDQAFPSRRHAVGGVATMRLKLRGKDHVAPRTMADLAHALTDRRVRVGLFGVDEFIVGTTTPREDEVEVTLLLRRHRALRSDSLFKLAMKMFGLLTPDDPNPVRRATWTNISMGGHLSRAWVDVAPLFTAQAA